jgi:hypothetical protein
MFGAKHDRIGLGRETSDTGIGYELGLILVFEEQQLAAWRAAVTSTEVRYSGFSTWFKDARWFPSASFGLQEIEMMDGDGLMGP